MDKKEPIINVIEDVEAGYLDIQMSLLNYQRTGYVGNEAAHAGYPTLEKGMKILKWLTKEG